MLSRCLLPAALLLASTGFLAAQTTSAPTPATAPTTPTAAASATAKAAELAVNAADSGKTLRLGDNTSVAISLAGNATTGYSWSLTKVDGPALEPVGDIQYVPDVAIPGMVGTGGTSIAKFRAVKAGQSVITLGYARPWEKNTPPAKSFTVTIVVDKAP